MLDVRLDHDPQRRVLQVRELREHVGLRLVRDSGLGIRDLSRDGRQTARELETQGINARNTGRDEKQCLLPCDANKEDWADSILCRRCRDTPCDSSDRIGQSERTGESDEDVLG